MKKEIMKKEETAVMVQEEPTNTGEILSSDVIIPRLLLMQGLSELVSERKATQGDMIKSLGSVKVGDPETPVEFIPLKLENTWVQFEKVGGKYEYRGSELRSSKNELLPWDYMQDGTEWRRVKTLNVYALLRKDMSADVALKEGEMPDLDNVLLPTVISFRSTSFNAGKMVVTHFAKATTMAVAPYFYYLTLKSTATKNEKGNFYIFEVDGKAKPLSKPEREVAQAWATRLAKSAVKVDESTGDEVKTNEGAIEI